MSTARATAVGLVLALSCADGADSPAPAPTPIEAPQQADTKVAVAPRTLVVHAARELDGVELGSLEHLDLALSAADRVGVLDEAEADPCAGLDLQALADRAPNLSSLRLSGCPPTSLATFGPRLRALALADLALDSGRVAQIAALSGLQSLELSRVAAQGVALQPLAALPLAELVLAELEPDTPLRLLGALYPTTLVRVAMSGRWIDHDTMVALSHARLLESMELHDPDFTNFSLNQIELLPRLREVVWSGAAFNDNSPLYFRDLPIERFSCACPRFGNAGVRQLRHSEGIERVELTLSRVGSGGLAQLDLLPKLRALVVQGVELSPVTFAALSRLHELRELEIAGPIADPTLAGLGELSGLEALHLRLRELDDRAAPELAKLVNLRVLDLGRTQVSDAALSSLAGMTELRELELDHTRITNRGLAHLAKLGKLEVLALDHTDVVDAAVAHLAGLSALRELSLDATLVTDASIDAILQLRGLERLGLAQTVVSDDGAARLAELPKLVALDVGRQPSGR